MNQLFAVDPRSVDLIVTVLVKLGIGALLGGLIGWERERNGRPAGIRTHMLVVIGVVLFTEVSKAFAPADPGRVAAQVVTGIGFLGAGTIMRTGLEIKGLTTAASIWAVAAVGMAISMGGPYLVIALCATVLCLFTLAIVSRIEERLFPGSKPGELILALRSSGDVMAVIKALGEARFTVDRTEILQTEPEIQLLLHIAGVREQVLAAACSIPGVKNATWNDH